MAYPLPYPGAEDSLQHSFHTIRLAHEASGHSGRAQGSELVSSDRNTVSAGSPGDGPQVPPPRQWLFQNDGLFEEDRAAYSG